MKLTQKLMVLRFLGAGLLVFLLAFGVQSSTSAETGHPAKLGYVSPVAPAWVAATDGKFQSQVYINWAASLGATHYKIYRATYTGSWGTEIGSSTVSSLYFSDTTAQAGQIFYYRVRACNSLECSAYSTYNAGFISHDSIGLYNPANGYFRLRLSNSPGATDTAYRFGPLGLIPIMGDWNGDGIDTPGVYDPTIGYFRLRLTNTPGPAQVSFQFGPTNWMPIAGDWNGNGADTIGLYNPANGVFRLRNYNSPGVTNIIFTFGPPNQIPIVGDWDGDGEDSIGVYTPSTSYFRLRNLNSGGPADHAFQFGVTNADPISGDWDMDGKDSIGVYTPSNGYFRLRNSNSAGSPNHQFRFGPLNWTVLSGDWDNQ